MGKQIASYNRTQDIELRQLTLENIATALKRGFIEHAKSFGEHSAWLKSRIENHDDSKEDARHEKREAIARKAQQILTTMTPEEKMALDERVIPR